MAKTMTYTDAETGQVYTDAYWKVTKISLCFCNSTGTVTISGFVSDALSCSGKMPIHSRTYEVDSTAFDTYFSVAALADTDLRAAAENFIDATEGAEGFFATAS